MAEIVELIYVEYPTGKGIENDPVRMVQQYFRKDGALVFEIDQWLEGQRKNREAEIDCILFADGLCGEGGHTCHLNLSFGKCDGQEKRIHAKERDFYNLACELLGAIHQHGDLSKFGTDNMERWTKRIQARMLF